MLLLSSAEFFISKLIFSKILSGTLSECQTVWIQIRTNVLFAKVHQQTTKVATIKESAPVIYSLTPPPQFSPLSPPTYGDVGIIRRGIYLMCFPAVPGKRWVSAVKHKYPKEFIIVKSWAMTIGWSPERWAF